MKKSLWQRYHSLVRNAWSYGCLRKSECPLSQTDSSLWVDELELNAILSPRLPALRQHVHGRGLVLVPLVAPGSDRVEPELLLEARPLIQHRLLIGQVHPSLYSCRRHLELCQNETSTILDCGSDLEEQISFCASASYGNSASRRRAPL